MYRRPLGEWSPHFNAKGLFLSDYLKDEKKRGHDMLQFILGDMTYQKQPWCLEDMSQLLAQGSIENVLYIVPDHIKFDSEVSVLKGLNKQKSGIFGSVAVQVYSFSRLAWYLLKDTGSLSKPALTKVGLGMLIRRILLEQEASLTIYRGEIRKVGFISELVSLFLELRSSDIQVSDLHAFEQAYHMQGKSYAAIEKIKELQLLYGAFNEAIRGHFVEREDLFDILAQTILKTDLSKTGVYIVGFERFSSKEQTVLLALMKQAYKVSVTLPLSRTYFNKGQDTHPLMMVPVKTYRTLCQSAAEQGVSRDEDVWITQSSVTYAADIQRLHQVWWQLHEDAPINTTSETSEHVFVQACSSKTEEVNRVVNEIARLVASGHYRYKDILVLMRQVEEYETIIKPLFKESDIPVFLDNAEAMVHHPLVEFLSALYAIQKRNWQYVDMMRLLRTELWHVGSRESIDLLENELLANGYQFLRTWQHEDVWENEGIRRRIVSGLTASFEMLNQAQTMRDGVEALYRIMEQLGIGTQLLQWRDTLLEMGDLERAKQHEQAWQTFINLLDEMVLVLDDMPFDRDDFYTILLNGFEQAEYSLVPPSLDQVTVASLDGKRESPNKVVFVIGARATQFPKTYEHTGILSYVEQETLQSVLENGKSLPLNSTQRTIVEPFVAYQVFSDVTDRLYVLYPKQAGEEESAYIKRLRQYVGVSDMPPAFGRTRQLLRHVLVSLRQQYDMQRDISETTKQLLSHIQHSELDGIFRQLQAGFQYKNVPVQLHLASELYQGQLHLSVSQLESYFKDPYSHFLRYGLQLKERQTAQVTPVEVGNVFHDVLDQFFKQLSQQHKRLEQLSLDEVQKLGYQIANSVFAQPQYKRFTLSKSLQFTQNLLTETLQNVLRQLHGKQHIVTMDTLMSEVSFAGTKTAPLYLAPITLDNGKQMLLRGKIDRLDSVADTYLSVIDYKSSAQRIDLNRFYEGLSLQLMTYLYVLAQNQDKIGQSGKKPMGAFYYHVANPYETVSDIMLDTHELVHTPVKLSGLLTLDAHDMAALDQDSQVYHTRFKKDGQYYTQHTMPVLTEQDMSMLFEYLVLKYQEAGNRILNGDIRLMPLKDESFIGSLQEYRSISLFDATLPENRYRQLKPNTQILDEIRRKVGGNNDTN